MNDKPRRPAAFRLDDPSVLVEDPGAPAEVPANGQGRPRVIVVPETEDPFAAEATVVRPAPPRRRAIGWGGLFLSAAGAFVAFAVGVWATDFIAGLFARNDWLGGIALTLAGIAGLALAAVVLREIVGLARLARVTRLRAEAEAAAAADDRETARRLVREVAGLYARRPETARGRAAVNTHIGEIIDGRDLLRLAERELMSSLDIEARRLVTAAAQRVSVVTAVSPRALIDVAFVLIETVRLVRRIGTLYGGRPSGLALVRLLRLALGHLAVTGGIAMTDSVVQQLIGHGLAARLSARLGEGIVNGMMTARIGLAALDVCRPLPWLANRPPGIKEVMSTLIGSGKAKEG